MTVRIEEAALVQKLLTALLREDTAGLRSRGRTYRAMDGPWFALGDVRIPVRTGDPGKGDLVTDLVVRAPFVRQCLRGGSTHTHTRLAAAIRVVGAALGRGLGAVEQAELATGLRALQQEAAAALAAAKQRRHARASVFGRLRTQREPGWDGWLSFETLAAFEDHPLHPLSAAKQGLTARQVRALAPEHHPVVGLRWVLVPQDGAQVHGRLPEWWPSAATGAIALPVHPAAAGAPCGTAEFAAGLPDLPVRPTLSLRTVAPLHEPQTQLKLPVPIRTLGQLNLRALKEDSLRDGALFSAVVTQIAEGDPAWADRVVVADESSWIHTASAMRSVLVRRWPDPRLAQQVIVPVAGLTARSPVTGRPLVADLADRFWDGDLEALLHAYLRTLLGWHVALWLRHGIVLEAHGQNVLVAIDPDGENGASPQIRLLMRDLDSGRAYPHALPGPPRDARLVTTDPRELSRLLLTTTLHQCAAAPLLQLAAWHHRPAAPALAMLRTLLGEAADVHAGQPDTVHLHRMLEAPRLAVKCGLTAATLLPKTRTGAGDVNKFYGADAPSYL